MKGESRKCVHNVDHFGKIQKKTTANYNSFDKVNPIIQRSIVTLSKVYGYVELCWWWIELVILRNHRKNYKIYLLENLKNKICIISDFKRSLPYWKTCFIPSVGGDFIQGRILYVIHSKVLRDSPDKIELLAKKEVSDIKIFFLLISS